MPARLCRSLVLLCLFQISLPTSPAQSTRSGDPHPRSVVSTRELAVRVRKSLVLIVTQDRRGDTIAQGSGFFLRPGFVVTNLHVLKRASWGFVKTLSDGKGYGIVSVAGFDIKHDLCVLKLRFDVGIPLALSMNTVAAGDDILVAGNPEGLEASFSKGIVSGVRSDSGLLQMDAAISPGSSGGPVVNSYGDVVGISVSSIVGGQNLNFAVPVRYLRLLELGWNLKVREAGALAVTDAEEQGFHGPVKAFVERKSAYEFDPVTKSPTYVQDKPVAASIFTPDGQELETTLFKAGAEIGKIRNEYSEDGLLKRVVPPLPQDFSPADAVATHVLHIHFDQTESSGKKGEKGYEEDTYDSAGHLVVQVFPAQGIKYVSKYDDLGREVESVGYKNGDLWLIFRYSYETNRHGDWVKERETLWSEGSPEDDFELSSESSRDITYYDDRQ